MTGNAGPALARPDPCVLESLHISLPAYMHISLLGYMQGTTKAQVGRLSAYRLLRLCARGSTPARHAATAAPRPPTVGALRPTSSLGNRRHVMPLCNCVPSCAGPTAHNYRACRVGARSTWGFVDGETRFCNCVPMGLSQDSQLQNGRVFGPVHLRFYGTIPLLCLEGGVRGIPAAHLRTARQTARPTTHTARDHSKRHDLDAFPLVRGRNPVRGAKSDISKPDMSPLAP